MRGVGRVDRPEHSESEVNASSRRRAWQKAHIGAAARRMLQRDADAFLHQAVSTPCLSVVRKAEGIWLEDADGRRYMDFHGNNAHHIGYGHPRLIEAIRRQLDDLPFAPRRFTCEPAIELAEKRAALAPAPLPSPRSPPAPPLRSTGRATR